MNIEKGFIGVGLFLAVVLIFSSFGSASIFDWFKQTVTGKATQPVVLNVSVGNSIPNITSVTTFAAQTIPADSYKTLWVNFTVYEADGVANLKTDGGMVNFTKVGEALRYNSTCTQIDASGNYANYTCAVDMWYFDGAGTWTIMATINDTNDAQGFNMSQTFDVNENTAFEVAPGTLSFPQINPGSTNITSNQNITINNTGNKPITDGDVQINATSLRGEQNPSYALWAGNFSVSNTSTTGTNPYECSRDFMSQSQYEPITGSTLDVGNYSLNDGTAQEVLHVCLTLAGSELISQPYSTDNEGSWTIKLE